MPFVRDCSPTKGKAEPASAFLSPVARDYPSRALHRFFIPAALRLFHQRTGDNVVGLPAKSRFCFEHLIHKSSPVNNLAATLPTGYSPARRSLGGPPSSRAINREADFRPVLEAPR